MSVNGIGYFGIFGGGYLSEETKRKLRALGIDPVNVTSESQAKILIRDALKKQALTEVETFEQKMISEAESELKNNSDTVFQMMNMTANVNRYILGL
ncbi:hypothetical protein IKR55_02420 [bacterium]|jgi:signal transduction histidine kinase|nr:hypothetical protein [bacterium]